MIGTLSARAQRRREAKAGRAVAAFHEAAADMGRTLAEGFLSTYGPILDEGHVAAGAMTLPVLLHDQVGGDLGEETILDAMHVAVAAFTEVTGPGAPLDEGEGGDHGNLH